MLARYWVRKCCNHVFFVCLTSFCSICVCLFPPPFHIPCNPVTNNNPNMVSRVNKNVLSLHLVPVKQNVLLCLCICMHIIVHAFVHVCLARNNMHLVLNQETRQYLWYIRWEDWRAAVRVKTFIRHGDRQTSSKQLYSLIPLQVWNPIHLQLLILVLPKHNPSSSTAVDIFVFSIGLYRFM